MKLLAIIACFAVIYSDYRVNGNWLFENENNLAGGWDKRSLASLAKSNQYVSNPPYFYGMPSPPIKRYLGSLKKQKQPKRSIPTEPGNPVVMKIEFKEDLKPVLTEYVQKLYKDTYDPRKVELFLDNLARAIYDRNEEFSLDSLKSLVRSGYFKKEPLMSKRNIAALTRRENQSFSEIRPLVPRSVDDSQLRRTLYQQYLDDQMYDGVDQVDPADEGETISAESLPGDSDDRDIAVEKRYLGSIVRSGWMPMGFGRGRHASVWVKPDIGNSRIPTSRARAVTSRRTVAGRMLPSSDPRAWYVRGGRDAEYVFPQYISEAESRGVKCNCKRSPPGQARGRGKPRIYIGNTPRTRQSTAPRRIPNNSEMVESWTPESEWSPE